MVLILLQVHVHMRILMNLKLLCLVGNQYLQVIILFLEILANVKEFLAFLFPKIICKVSSFQCLHLKSHSVKFIESLVFKLFFLIIFLLCILDFSLVDLIHALQFLVEVSVSLSILSKFFVSLSQLFQNLIQIDILQNLNLSHLRLQFFNPFALAVLVLLQP